VIGDSRMEMGHEQHRQVGMAMSSGRDSMEDVSMQHEQVAPAHDHGMSMRELSAGRSLSWITGTWLMSLAAVWLTSRWVPVTFSCPDDFAAGRLAAKPDAQKIVRSGTAQERVNRRFEPANGSALL